jgi:SAM-dependent methyltransferase
VLNHLVRYDPVVRLVRAAGGETVLEVGSGSDGLARWLAAERSVTAVDLSFDGVGQSGDRVTADARALPFPDSAFDVVVALDMLEHVPAEDRPGVVAELARTARIRLIVACPTGEKALDVDRRLAGMLERRGESYAGSWLEEHLANGFPATTDLATMLAPYGRVRLLPNESLRAHELLMRAEMTRRPRRVTDALERLLMPVLYGRGDWRIPVVSLIRGFDRGEAYRTIAVVDLP